MGMEAKKGDYMQIGEHNNERQHQSLGYRTPADVYFSGVLEQIDLPKPGLNESMTKLNFPILLS
jgi:hypothetical protein